MSEGIYKKIGSTLREIKADWLEFGLDKWIGYKYNFLILG